MTDPATAAPDAAPKADPETLVLRAAPGRVTRFRRGAIVAIAAAGSTAIVGVAWLALKPATLSLVAPSDDKLVGAKAPPDALAGAPTSYGDVPKLGPPLPGDLGRPILERQRQLGTALPADPAADAAARAAQEAEAERQRIAAEQKAARESGVMLQIGTRNTQNFELLKLVGRQKEFPVLLKRGFGITLDESLHAAEYLASEGNQKVIFALRGMKTNIGDPHRNMVDFAHIPVVKRLTRMPVCIDPSHSVGSRARSSDQILDIMHITAQGVIAGANMILVDFHPEPSVALVDGPQALRLSPPPGHF